MILVTIEMWNYIYRLQDPNLVAAVQRYFGVIPDLKEADANCDGRYCGIPAEEKVCSSNSSTKQPELKKFVITRKPWYYVFLISTHLGDEFFYAVLFSFLFWNVDVFIARKIVLIWCFSLSTGQVLKDIIKWPRPGCPPVYCLQQKWSQEYGMPSTHAVIGVTIPFSVFYFATLRYQLNLILGILVSLLFCFMICLSRLYLGVHSVLDIIVGLIYGAICLVASILLPQNFDKVLLLNSWSPFYLILFCSLFIALYPKSIYPVTRKDTTIVLGAFTGIYVGLWTCYHLHSSKQFQSTGPSSLESSIFRTIGSGFERMVIGILTVFAFRTLFESAYRFILQVITDSKTSTPSFFVLSSYFLKYFLVGFNISFVVPYLFKYFGIERSSYFDEV